MTKNTADILATVLTTDATISDEQRELALSILKGEEERQARQAPIGKLYSRRQAAEVLGCSPQAVDYYSRMGWLPKTKLGMQSRASGITEEALRAFINGNQTSDQTKGKPQSEPIKP